MWVTVLFYPPTYSQTHGANTELQGKFLKAIRVVVECTERVSGIVVMRMQR